MTSLSKFNVYRLLLLLVFTIGIAISGENFNESSKKARSPLQKVNANDVFTAMTINNIFSYYTNNGDGSLNPFTGDGGFELISANRGITIFEEGFVWGGKHMKDATVKVGGSTYNHGLQAGKITTPGTTTSDPVAESPSLAKNRIYRVRPDVGPGTTFDAAMEDMLNKSDVLLHGKYEALSAREIYDQYVKDWNEWPAADGAPYTDKDGVAGYNPANDVPGVPGADQTIWYVANDLDGSRTFLLSGSDPIGIEFQRTIWAYNRTGALGNTVFQKNIIINKSGYDIDSMYVAQWADPDLGGGLGYTDDFTGCDTTLSLGFVYNGDASDGFFGSKPAATGFDFFQGPLVDADSGQVDSGKVDGKYILGKKNLGMTSFNFFINSNPTYSDPPLNNPDGTKEWYNLLRGLVGPTGAPYVNPTTNQVTTFVLSGDPVTNRGWIDGVIGPPGDRRMALCSGPFTMANGDVQEIVVAAMVGHGSNRLSSVSVLKFYDQIAQSAYDVNFDLPTPPASPVVQIGELSNEIVLNWGDPATANITESQDEKGYAFEGYNVYQLPGPGFNNPKLLATYDKVNSVLNILDNVYDDAVGTVIVKPVQFGNDYGISRNFVITKDYITDKPLVNGQTYYFAVTAYNYNGTPGVIPASLESAPRVLQIIPQSSKPGVRYAFKAGDTISVAHTGVSDGVVIAEVVNPSMLTGHEYRVSFDTAGGTTTWQLTDVTANSVLLSNQAQTPFGANPEAYTVDGFQIATFGPPPGMQDWDIPNGARRFTFADGYANFEGFEHTIGWDDPSHFFGIASEPALGADQLKNVLLRLAPATSGTATNPDAGDNPYGGWDENNPGSDPNFSYGYRYLRAATAAAARPEFAPYIVNASAGYAYQDYKRGVPLSAWDMETDPPTRLAVGFLENNVATGLVDGKWWPGANGTGASGSSGSTREWLFIFNQPYTDATPDASLQLDILNNSLPVMWWLGVQRRGGNDFSAGDEFLIIANHINTLNDQFTFTATAPANTTALAKEDIKKINVFPNPYFGLNSKEPNKYTKYVTFSHLPRKATISIVNLAGVRVRKLDKDDASQFFNWDLKNESGLPVASGMYVAYIDLGTLGTKILKLAVIQELQQLDKY